MSSSLKDWKPGPARSTVEKELRSLMNDVEARLPVPSVVDAALGYTVRGDEIRQMVMHIFAECMAERGIYPKDDN